MNPAKVRQEYATPDIEVSAVNVTDRIAIRTDGLIGKITNFFYGGEETDDACEATTCVIGWPDGKWYTVDLTQFETVKTQ